MRRITMTLDDALVEAVDAVAQGRGYAGRSEAMRDLIRRGLAEERRQVAPGLDCVATLTFVAQTGVRDLGRRLAEMPQERHDLVVAQMQVPLDHETTLHTLVLRGRAEAIQALADALATQRGIRHDTLGLIPARIELCQHHHGGVTSTHTHVRT